MATTQQILDDINLRYRNTFSVPQILVWFNEEQRELFDILELDSPPYTFQTLEGENFYPFPSDFDVTKVKTVTMQYDDTTTPSYIEVPFNRNDDDQYASYGQWWTVVSNAMYLYVEGGVPDNRSVYLYLDSDPTEVTVNNLNVSIDLPAKYVEILKYGVLKRIAQARKDTIFASNYDQSREQKILDVMWARKLAEPDWVSPADVQPHSGNPFGYGSFAYRFGWWGGQ